MTGDKFKTEALEQTLEQSIDKSLTRLPCRGCTQNCSNYNRCEGKPWRLDDKKT